MIDSISGFGMHINTYIKFSAVTFSSALMLGCSSVGTYYPKSSTHIPKSNSETQGATTVARLPVEASSIEFLKSQPSSGISQAPTLSIELSPDIVPVEYESTKPYDENVSKIGEPVQVPLPEPELLTDSSATGMTLEQLEVLAIENNPSIKQASASAGKVSGLRTQVGLKPNPQLSYFAEEMGSESSAGLQGASISQTFVTGNKLEASQRVIDQDYQRILWDVETQRYRVRTDVRTRFYQALAAQQRLQLAQNFLQVAEKGLHITQQRFDAQEGAKPDVLQAEIQLSEIKIIQQRAVVEYQAAWNTLATIVGLPEMSHMPLQGELPTQMSEREFETSYQQLMSASPELQSAMARVNVARATLKRQDIQAIPNMIGQFGVGQDNSNGNGFANVQLSVTLPVHNRNQGNIQAAYADYCRATQDVARLKLSIRSRLVDSLRNYNQAGISVEQYSTIILPKAQQSMDLSEQAYLAGQFDFLRMLNARKTYFETNLAYVQARAELAIADAQIEGLLLSGGLKQPAGYDRDNSHRQQAFGQQ
jgi:outer membrane protein, heavy metal efflux system